jgi:hypothetical protein
MINRVITGTTGTPLPPAERTAIRTRTTYEPAQHIFTKRELDHLHFLRWLVYNPAWNRAIDQAAGEEVTVVADHEKVVQAMRKASDPLVPVKEGS